MTPGFFLDFPLEDVASGEPMADLAAVGDLASDAALLYVVGADPELELELAYDSCASPTSDAADYDTFGTWWRSTGGEVTLSGEFVEEVANPCGGSDPIYEGGMTLSAVTFEDLGTGEAVPATLEALEVSGLEFGRLPCEG